MCSRVAKVVARSYRVAAPRQVRVVVAARLKRRSATHLYFVDIVSSQGKKESANNSFFFYLFSRCVFGGDAERGRGGRVSHFKRQPKQTSEILSVRVGLPSPSQRACTDRSVVNLCLLSLESIRKGPTHAHTSRASVEKILNNNGVLQQGCPLRGLHRRVRDGRSGCH